MVGLVLSFSNVKHPDGRALENIAISQVLSVVRKYPSSQTKHLRAEDSSFSRGMKSIPIVEKDSSPPD